MLSIVITQKKKERKGVRFGGLVIEIKMEISKNGKRGGERIKNKWEIMGDWAIVCAELVAADGSLFSLHTHPISMNYEAGVSVSLFEFCCL